MPVGLTTTLLWVATLMVIAGFETWAAVPAFFATLNEVLVRVYLEEGNA